MRHLAKVEHKDFVCNRLTQYNRQIELGFLKLLASDHALTGYDLRILVRNFNTDGSLTRYRSNDTNAICRQTQRDIIFQTTNLRNTYSLFGGNFIQSHRRPYRCLDRTDFNTKAAQSINDTVFIRILFVHINRRIVILKMLHQIDCRETIVFQILHRIIRFLFRSLIFFFGRSRLYLKPGFILTRQFVLRRRSNRISHSRFKDHSHSFPFISRRNFLVRFRFVHRRFFFRFLCLYVHHRSRRRCLFISTFQIEFNFLRLRGCKFLRSFCRCHFFLFFLLTFQETQSKELAQPDNRSCTYIYKEADCRYQQNHPHTGNSHLRNQPTAYIITVHTSQIDERILIMIHQGEPEKHGEPHQ